PGHAHRCYTDPFVRFIYTEDAPGSGKLPIKLRCASSTDGRARVGAEYEIGWTDPLDPDSGRRLQMILGKYVFVTWLAVAPNNSKGTKTILPLYRVQWEGRYFVKVDAQARWAKATRGAGRSR